MSRQNKVNPGMYTQRGRLTQDDAARELKRQRVGWLRAHLAAVEEGSLPAAGLEESRCSAGAETSGDNESEDAPDAQPATPAKPKRTARAKAKTAKKTAIKAKTARARRPRNRHEARRDEDRAKGRAGPQRRRRWTKASETREAPKELTHTSGRAR